MKISDFIKPVTAGQIEKANSEKKVKILTVVAFLLFLFLFHAPAHAGLCDDTDALKIVQDTIMHASQAGADGAQKIQPIQDIYKNKWLISCAVANGITNLDKAGDYLMNPNTIAAYKGLVQGGEVASKNIEKLGESMKKLAGSPSFKNSVVDRTRVIGLYILLLAFMIGIAAKLYALIIGADNTDPIDFALIFIRFITLLMFITFMKPLAFYGMQISTVVSNMLLDAPIQIVVSSNVGYTGPGALTEGSSASTPWFSSALPVTSRYGKLRDVQNTGVIRPHYGIDFGASVGTRITAPYTGTATCKNMGGYGLTIDVIPADNTSELHRAAHLSECRFEGDPDLAEDFKKGKAIPVSAGQGIGLSGNSGRSTGPHLHIEARIGGTPKDPSLVYAVRSGSASPTSQAPQPGTGDPLASSGSQAGQGAVGTYSYEGNDALTTDAMFQELMRLKSSYLDVKSHFSLWDLITGGFQLLFMFIINTIARWIAGAVLSVLIILSDTMMAITLALGPIVAGLTLIPVFEKYLQNWIRGYVTFLFYQPLAACFTILSFVIMIVSLDTGSAGYLILVICYVMGCMKIPQIADGLSTSALIGVSMMMAFAPAMLTAKVTGLAAGGLAGGPVGQAVANKAIEIAGNTAGIAGGSSPKASSGGTKGGFVKIIAVTAAVLLGLLVMAMPASSAISQQDKKDLMDMSKTMTYPSAEMVNAVISAVGGGKLQASPGGMTDIGGNDVKVYNDGDSDNDMNGIYNTSYQDAIDMPMTRFVLGKAVVDGSMIYELAFITSYNKRLEDGTPRELSSFLIMNGFLDNMGQVIQAVGQGDVLQLRTQIRARGDVVTTFLYEAQQAIVTKLMFWVPIYILILMFFIQIATVSYLKIVEPTIGEKVSYFSLVPRFILYAIMIYFLKDAVAVCITFSNYISNAIVPIELQRSLMANITSKTGGLISGYSLSGFMVMIFRLMTYLSIKILLMARDMFMTITVIVGPVCIALGFFTKYRGEDPIHQFFTGWIENFVKLLFWGPLAAVMLFCLGILSVLTALDMMSVISVAVTALAFLYAAGNIPNMAERMSSVALGGLLAAMAPFMMKGLSMAARGGTGGVFMISNLLYGLGGKMTAPYSIFSGSFNPNAGAGKGPNGGLDRGPGGQAGTEDGLKKTVTADSVPKHGGIPGKEEGKTNKAKGSDFDNMLKDNLRDSILPGAGKAGQADKTDRSEKTVKALLSQSDVPKAEERGKIGIGGLQDTSGHDAGNPVTSVMSKGAESALKAGKAGEIMAKAQSMANSFDISQLHSSVTSGEFGLVDFLEAHPSSDMAETLFMGMAGLKTAQNIISQQKNDLNPIKCRKIAGRIAGVSRDLEAFVRKYADGGFPGITESDAAEQAKLMFYESLADFDKFYKDSLSSPGPLFMRGSLGKLPSVFGEGNSGTGYKEISGAVEKIKNGVHSDVITGIIRNGGHSVKNVFVGTDGERGLINHEGFMINSGLASESAPVRAALTGLLGVRMVLGEMPGIKGSVNPVDHYRTAENLRETEQSLLEYIKTYMADGYKDIDEMDFTANIIAETSAALNSFDSLRERAESVNQSQEGSTPSDRGSENAETTYSDPITSSGFWGDPLSFIPRDVVSVIPPSARNWLSNNMRREGASRVISDISGGIVLPHTIFGAPLGSEESRSVFEGYGLEPPSDVIENAAFQMLGLGVMKECASRAGAKEAVYRIDRGIASVSGIIKTGGVSEDPVISDMYESQGGTVLEDPAAYEARSAAQYYSENVHIPSQGPEGAGMRTWNAGDLERRAMESGRYDPGYVSYEDHKAQNEYTEDFKEEAVKNNDGGETAKNSKPAKGGKKRSVIDSIGSSLKKDVNILNTIVKQSEEYYSELAGEIRKREGGELLHVGRDDDTGDE